MNRVKFRYLMMALSFVMHIILPLLMVIFIVKSPLCALIIGLVNGGFFLRNVLDSTLMKRRDLLIDELENLLTRGEMAHKELERALREKNNIIP